MRRTTVAFMHGTLYKGNLLKKAELRELNGYDQELLLEHNSVSAIDQVKYLLANIVDFGKQIEQGEKEYLLNSLAIGDLAVLILELRRITFGDTLQCLITCPSCKENMSADIGLTQLLQKPNDFEPKDVYEVKVDDFTLKLRPVTGVDLSSVIEYDEASAMVQLVTSCVLDSTPKLPEKLDDQLLAAISSKLNELDPQADILLDLTCPNCKYRFQAPFFPEDFFLREIDARKSQFEGEVHWIAFNYHWSEDEILALPLSKRKKYVDLINRTLSGENM
jgi:hypothetical protein